MNPPLRNPTSLVTPWVVAAAVWLGAVSAGLGGLAYYSQTPGLIREAPPTWESSPAMERSSGLPTLVMLVHPKCPCSRASLNELAVLMTRLQGRIEAYVLMSRPEGAEPGWEETSLWDKANSIPGVRVLSDVAGAEAGRLGAMTSGDTLVYDAEGQLVFRGGITSARGHEGGSRGRASIQSIVDRGSAELSETPVFGCPIFSGAAGGESGDVVFETIQLLESGSGSE